MYSKIALDLYEDLLEKVTPNRKFEKNSAYRLPRIPAEGYAGLGAAAIVNMVTVLITFFLSFLLLKTKKFSRKLLVMPEYLTVRYQATTFMELYSQRPLLQLNMQQLFRLPTLSVPLQV